MTHIINLHQELIAAELGRSITDLESTGNFGQQHVYIYWYEKDGELLYSVARIKGNEEAFLSEFVVKKKADVKEMVDVFCETAKQEDDHDEEIVSFKKDK
ncbi:hypothetical protein CN275_07995 [Bacillus anthracis]|uniref:hypothetical protein n=1 Tax=unclassified Bacillus (in: firmicutes) TaxID=185979 RepID=UPI000BF991A0|nr:hypothetical protein CN275_07995 [Bacillus anthracis]